MRSCWFRFTLGPLPCYKQACSPETGNTQQACSSLKSSHKIQTTPIPQLANPLSPCPLGCLASSSTPPFQTIGGLEQQIPRASLCCTTHTPQLQPCYGPSYTERMDAVHGARVGTAGQIPSAPGLGLRHASRSSPCANLPPPAYEALSPPTAARPPAQQLS